MIAEGLGDANVLIRIQESDHEETDVVVAGRSHGELPLAEELEDIIDQDLTGWAHRAIQQACRQRSAGAFHPNSIRYVTHNRWG